MPRKTGCNRRAVIAYSARAQVRSRVGCGIMYIYRTDIARYSKLRNTVVSALRASKRRYFTGLNTSNKKQFWKTFKVATRKESLIPTLVHDDNEANSDKEKADVQ